MSAVHGASGTAMPGIPGYELLQLLGEGGMGRVFLARQEVLKRPVCVKVLSLAHDEEAELCRARFCREAELLASVSHPNILSIFDFGTTADSGLPYLVTEYVEGGDLRHLLDTGPRLPVAQVRSIVGQVGEALRVLHQRGIIHRDLKPENILRHTGSLFKVGDFGIAVMQDKTGSLTRTHRALGTVGYVSPEQQYGLKVDERSDQYSLAAVTYELLTGRRPLGLFSPPSVVNPQLPREVDAVVMRGLAEEREGRFASVGEFSTALDRALAASPRGSRRVNSVLAGLAAALMIGGGLVFLRGAGPMTPTDVLSRVRGLSSAPPHVADQAARIVPEKSGAPAPGTPPRSPEFRRLVELRAYRIWEQNGRPEGAKGEAAARGFWVRAEGQILDEVNLRAYRIWEKQGCPQGAAGEAVREKNFRTAEVELLGEVEAPSRDHPSR
jgi:serine/threonine protein kinase